MLWSTHIDQTLRYTTKILMYRLPKNSECLCNNANGISHYSLKSCNSVVKNSIWRRLKIWIWGLKYS